MNKLDIYNLDTRHIGLTKALAECYAEAASICFDRNFNPPQNFELTADDDYSKVKVNWTIPSIRCKNAWANKDDATRDGAYACAIAATEICYDMYAIMRAETLTGADYYVSKKNNSAEDFEDCYRLEVSGTDSNSYEVHRRLKVKMKQTIEGKSNLPAIAAVIGFREKHILLKTVEETL